MGIPISDVMEHGLLSDEVLDCIPHECEYCGSAIEFTDSLRQIYCPNRYCTLKVAARLELMAKEMKADGWGEATCREVCKRFGMKSPYQVFLLEGKQCDGVPAFGKKIKSICDWEKRRIELWQVVKLGNIPSIDTIAYKIFGGYDSLEEAYEDIQKLQVPFIADKLGLRNSSSGVMAVNIYNTLMEYKDELLFGESKFDIYKPTGDTIYIAITGGVQGFNNKSEFIRYINNRYGGKVNAMLMNSVSSKIHALVSDSLSTSNKYKTAQRLLARQKSENLQREAMGEPRVWEILISDSRNLIMELDKIYLLGSGAPGIESDAGSD